MPEYRVFDLDSAGHVAGPPYELVCGSDEAAVAEAWQLRADHCVEVWQGVRIVTRLPGPQSQVSSERERICDVGVQLEALAGPCSSSDGTR
jgi:hypothetical protein